MLYSVSSLLHDLDDTLVLDPFQSGFHPSLRMETALDTLTDNLYRQLDQDKLMLLFLLDLAAVFDMVNDDLLMSC